ncbi:hypothetical protein CLRAG_33430 [Clostridium ragsdalei P11]|uniref:Replication-relaxation n=1 Tax=Clostridium ragsdalei P11 TaxID=1353534 RepID=A0A1A6AKT4_9CLOT|nr:hypothetical protein [Clostridium ragsdalei]OBR90695.1 hypothetical protein CLRAG_33430 [Clostridium ragsdalei P11]
MLSKHKREILNFIQEEGSITIHQCAKIIYHGRKYGYDMARKTLRSLYQDKAIARYRYNMTAETIYYINQRLGIHALKLLDVYAEFINLGCTIETFKKKYRIYTNGKKYREIDALLELNYQEYFIPIILEIDYSHMTSIEKLKEIYNCRYFQELYKQQIGESIYPLTIIVRPVVENRLLNDNDFSILYSDFDLPNLAKALE